MQEVPQGTATRVTASHHGPGGVAFRFTGRASTFCKCEFSGRSRSGDDVSRPDIPGSDSATSESHARSSQSLSPFRDPRLGQRVLGVGPRDGLPREPDIRDERESRFDLQAFSTPALYASHSSAQSPSDLCELHPAHCLSSSREISASSWSILVCRTCDRPPFLRGSLRDGVPTMSGELSRLDEPLWRAFRTHPCRRPRSNRDTRRFGPYTSETVAVLCRSSGRQSDVAHCKVKDAA